MAGATAYSDALVRAKFKVTDYVNDFDSFLNIENIKLLGFAITILLVLIYVFAKTFFPKNANNTGVVTGRVMVDKETQIATGGETNIATITYDEHMQLGAYIGQLGEKNEKLIMEVIENLQDYVHHIDNMSLRQMRENAELLVWATSNGERWHSSPMWTIANRNPKQQKFCQRCKGGAESESSFSPM